jgi:hypothetical protein
VLDGATFPAQSIRNEREVGMPTNGANDAVRRSSEPAKSSEQDVRRVVYDSLNERRLTRERIIASLLLCPGPDARGLQERRL